jgi:polyribonucleotide nucleotidyltransferase
VQKIVAESGAKIDIEEDGRVFISSPDENSVNVAAKMIEGIVRVPIPGEIYVGKVVTITDFGAFVEILPGKDGLVHISRLAKGRVARVEDVVRVGDSIKVEVLDIDRNGKINLKKID